MSPLKVQKNPRPSLALNRGALPLSDVGSGTVGTVAGLQLESATSAMNKRFLMCASIYIPPSTRPTLEQLPKQDQPLDHLWQRAATSSTLQCRSDRLERLRDVLERVVGLLRSATVNPLARIADTAASASSCGSTPTRRESSRSGGGCDYSSSGQCAHRRDGPYRVSKFFVLTKTIRATIVSFHR
jgi:hypothetical protein